MARTKVCSCCKIEKSWDDFYMRNDTKAPQSQCKKCTLIRTKEHYQKNKETIKLKHKSPIVRAKMYKQRFERVRKNKQKAIDYKGGKCARCGYNKCMAAMDFHHIDLSKKERQVSDILGGAWEKSKKELDKCILLCANCHRELHYVEKNK